jgi:hypothetical protein
MSIEVALLPCPFCGNAKLREGQGNDYFIECEPCYDAFGTSVLVRGNARHDVVARWNRRASPALTASAVGKADADAVDAGRYRWLRERSVCFAFAHDIWRTRTELDAAIDSAMATSATSERGGG